MKQILLAAIVAACVSCSSDNGEEQIFDVQSSTVNEPTEVVLTFSPYEVEAMTRTVTSISSVVTRLDVWIVCNGDTIALQQTNSDPDFGSLSVTLDKTKTYTLYAVGHKADGATMANGVISFASDKITHTLYYSTSFCPGTSAELSCTMSRIVAQFAFTTTDACPADVKKMRFTISGVYDRWNVSTGGTHQLDRVSTFENFTKKNDGTVGFAIYAITTDAETLHDVTVVALDENDQEVQTRTFTDVPLRNGYKTKYSGVFFTDTPATAAFMVDDWNEYETVTF